MLEFPTNAPRVAVVTGAGRGLGRELALVLAGQGLQVAGFGRNLADLERLAADAAAGASAGRILPVVADVADRCAMRAGFRVVDAELGPVDTLVNNAAVYPLVDFLDETPESFARTMDVNLGGMVTAAMLALERMVPRGQGRIVNVTSFAGRAPAHMSAAYSVSKGAARILTQAMVTDLGDRFPDIVITEWIPGALKTPMGIPEGRDPAEAARWGAALALWRDPALMGASFVEDRELLPEASLKRRLFNRLTGRRPEPRQLAGRL